MSFAPNRRVGCGVVSMAIMLMVWGPGPARGQAQNTLVLGNPSHQVVLPPEHPWSGKSQSLVLSPGEKWATPFEVSGMVATPRYRETVTWLRSLAEAAPQLEMVSLGKSPEGRDIWMMVASQGGWKTAEELRKEGKPTLLAQAGIHSGEIDGKDAGMMLLRDLTVGKKTALLQKANFLFVPIFNVDGHERFSAFNRINQRGPVEMGWRTNARNLNLNRDYAKLATPEMRAMIRGIRDWQPDLYLDLHVTDGADYQYDITWGYNGPHGHSPNACAWMDAYLTPDVTANLTVMGHIPGPLVFAADPMDMNKGNNLFTFNPRFSNGYGDARHLATVLVENHSLKPYPQRVLGTYVLLESALTVLGRHGKELRNATRADKRDRKETVPLDWTFGSDDSTTVPFKGVRSRVVPSPVSGRLHVEWTGEPVDLNIPLLSEDLPVAAVSRPRAYLIPPAWTEVIEILDLHGIETETLDKSQVLSVTMYRIPDGHSAKTPYEGRVRAGGTPVPETRTETFPPGTVRVSTDQDLGTLAVLLLEPEAADSFYRWGFFLEILQRTESVEGYVMEPLAANMLAGDPELAAEFLEKLSTDGSFAADGKARLDWFYERSPYFDARWRLYPVARVEGR